MWRWINLIPSLVVGLYLLAAGPALFAASPADTVRQIGDEFSAAAQAAKGNQAQAVTQVGQVLDRWFSVTNMARAALPEAYRDKADAAYIAAYRANLSREFVRRTLRAGEGSLNPIGVRPLGPLTLVGTEVREDGRLVRMIEFYLQPSGASYRVNNVAVEGVLVTAQQQRDFMPILISGDMPGLIAHLNGVR